jgi:hypothetical protein
MMETVPNHIIGAIYSTMPNSQLLYETVPAKYTSDERRQTPSEEEDPNFWINKGINE